MLVARVRIFRVTHLFCAVFKRSLIRRRNSTRRARRLECPEMHSVRANSWHSVGGAATNAKWHNEGTILGEGADLVSPKRAHTLVENSNVPKRPVRLIPWSIGTCVRLIPRCGKPSGAGRGVCFRVLNEKPVRAHIFLYLWDFSTHSVCSK